MRGRSKDRFRLWTCSAALHRFSFEGSKINDACRLSGRGEGISLSGGCPFYYSLFFKFFADEEQRESAAEGLVSAPFPSLTNVESLWIKRVLRRGRGSGRVCPNPARRAHASAFRTGRRPPTVC